MGTSLCSLSYLAWQVMVGLSVFISYHLIKYYFIAYHSCCLKCMEYKALAHAFNFKFNKLILFETYTILYCNYLFTSTEPLEELFWIFSMLVNVCTVTLFSVRQLAINSPDSSILLEVIVWQLCKVLLQYKQANVIFVWFSLKQRFSYSLWTG